MCVWALAYLSSPNINRGCSGGRLANAQNASRGLRELGCTAAGGGPESPLERALAAAMAGTRPTGPEAVIMTAQCEGRDTALAAVLPRVRAA